MENASHSIRDNIYLPSPLAVTRARHGQASALSSKGREDVLDKTVSPRGRGQFTGSMN